MAADLKLIRMKYLEQIVAQLTPSFPIPIDGIPRGTGAYPHQWPLWESLLERQALERGLPEHLLAYCEIEVVGDDKAFGDHDWTRVAQ